MSVTRLLRLFPDDETAESWFAQARWPNGIFCPHCQSRDILIGAAHPSMPYRCRGCRRYFSVKYDSAMQSSKLGCRVWAIAICLLSQHPKGISSIQLAKILDISQEAAWFLGHRIREAWDNSEPMFGGGETEIDEAFFGGKEKNKHADKKLHENWPAGKTTVSAALNRQQNRIVARVTNEPREFALERVRPGATVYTDSAREYGRLPGIRHRTVNHSVGEYMRDKASTNGIESFWSLLKRGYMGTYHWMSPKHLQRYVNEFAGRHNIRKLEPLERMESIVRGMVGKRLTYKMLVGT